MNNDPLKLLAAVLIVAFVGIGAFAYERFFGSSTQRGRDASPSGSQFFEEFNSDSESESHFEGTEPHPGDYDADYPGNDYDDKNLGEAQLI